MILGLAVGDALGAYLEFEEAREPENYLRYYQSGEPLESSDGSHVLTYKFDFPHLLKYTGLFQDLDQYHSCYPHSLKQQILSLTLSISELISSLCVFNPALAGMKLR